MNKSSDKFAKAIDAEVLIHGQDHPAVARAHTQYGEWLLSEGDVGQARHHLETALRTLTSCLGPGVVTEELVDAHYRLGKAIAAESRITGTNAASKSHLLKTLAMREDYDAKIALERLSRTPGPGSGQALSSPVVQQQIQQELPTLSSGLDSTLIYADLAESERASGNYKESCVLYLKSLKLRRAKFGDVSAPVAQVLNKYAEVLRLSLKYSESKAAAEEALAIFTHLFGPKHVQVTEAMNSLGQIQRLLGNLQEAEALLLEALKIRREMHGDYHVNTASSLNNLAEVCREKEDFFQAINYHNASIEAFTNAVGAEHPGTINAKGNMGVTLRRQAKQSSDLGHSLVREALDYLKTQQYDADHPWMAKFDTENAMAQAEHLSSEGKHEEALELYETLINKKHIIAQLNATTNSTTQAKGQGGQTSTPMSSSTSPAKRAAQDVVLLTEGKVQGLVKRAVMLCGKGQLREAEQVYRNLVAASTKILGLENILIYRAMVSHATILTHLAQYSVAIEILQTALQSRVDIRGPDDVEVTEASQALAEVYRHCANFDSAVPLYVHCLEILGDALRKDPFSMEKTSKAYSLNELFVRVIIGLAKLQATKGVYPKARGLLAQGKETAARTLGEDHPLYLDLLTLEGSIHFDCGNVTLAVELHKQCLAQRMSIQSPQVYSSLHHLARISLFLCDYTQAASYLDESIGLFETALQTGSPRMDASPGAGGGRNGKEVEEEEEEEENEGRNFADELPHPTLLRLNHTKSLLLLAVGCYSESQQLMESTLVSRRISLGGRHHRVADSLVALAQLGHALGLPSKVKDGLELALDIYKEQFIYDIHKDVSACRYQMAINALQCGRYGEAISSLGEIKDQRTGFYNKMGVLYHVDVAQATAALARAMAIRGESLDQAESLAVSAGSTYCQALNLGLGGFPEEETTLPTAAAAAVGSLCFSHLHVADALEALGIVCSSRGKYKDARAHFSHVVAIRSNILSIRHPLVFAARLLAVENIYQPGYYASAKPHVSSYCDFVLATYSDKSIHRVQSNLLQGRVLMNTALGGSQTNNVGISDEQQEAAVTAEPYFTQALFTIRDTIGEDNELYASITCELASCLQAQSKAKYTTSEQLLKQAKETLTKLCGSVLHLRVLDATLRRCLLFIAQRSEEDALPLLKNQIIPNYSENLGVEHPYTMFARGLLGVCENDKKRGTGLENIRTALLLFEDYEQLPFAADHPFLNAIGGYESSAKSRTTEVLASSESGSCLLAWCMPEEVEEDLTDEQKRVAALHGEEQQKKRYLFRADTPIPEIDSVVLFDPENWGAVGSRRRGVGGGKGGKNKQKALPSVVGSLFHSLLARNPPYAIGSGESSITAIGILQGAVPASQEAIYGDALGTEATVADKARATGASVQRVKGAFGKLQQMAAEEAARQAATTAKEVEGEEKDVRAKLNEVRRELEDEETRLAEVKLQKMTEEAEAEEIRAAREQEEEEVRQLEKQKKIQELAIMALITQKETDAAEAKVLAESRAKHEQDLARVADELMAKMEEIAQAEEELKKLRSLHAVVQASPVRAPGDAAPADDISTVEDAHSGVGGTEQIARAATVIGHEGFPPAVSAGSVATTNGIADAAEEEFGGSGTTADSTQATTHVAVATGTGIGTGKQLTAKEQKRLHAIEAATFMFNRAKEMDNDGWHAKARPLLEECVAIRETHLKSQPPHLEALVALAQNVISCQDFHAAWPLLATALERRRQDLQVKAAADKAAAADAAEAEADDGIDGLLASSSGGAGRSNASSQGSSIEIAEILQIEAWNLYQVGKYLAAAPKMSEASKMFISVVGDAHQMTGRCMAQQVLVLLALARLDEAKALADRSFAILNKLYGTKDVTTTFAMIARARVLIAMGKARDAKPLVEQSISMRKRLLNERHPLVAECFLLMGKLLMQQSKLGEAERWLAQARNVLLDTVDEHNLPVADVEYEQAKLLSIYGKVNEATALFERVAECRRKYYPLFLTAEEIEANTPKPKTEEELDAEADLELKSGKKTEPFKPKPPVTHSGIQDCLEALGELSLKLGQFTQADDYFRQVGKLRKEYCTEEASTDGTLCHPDLAANFYLRAESLRLRGVYDEAQPIHQLALDLRNKVFGKDHPASVQSSAALADLLANTGRLEEAEQAYRKVLKRTKDVLSDDHYLYAETQSAYADCLRRIGRLEKARKNLDESIAARRMLFEEANPDHLALIEAVNNASLLSMEEMRAPPPAVDAELSLTSNEVAAAGAAGAAGTAGASAGPRVDEDDDQEDAAAIAKLQEQSRQQARIAQSQNDEDESVLTPLPPADRPEAHEVDEAAARTALLLEQGEAVAEGQLDAEEEPPETFLRDDNGVPIFNDSSYRFAIESLEQAVRVLELKYTPFVPPGSQAEPRPHPWTLNIRGNIGIVEKLEFEEKLRFMYALKKEDRKKFNRKELRQQRLAAAALKAAVASQDSLSTFTETSAQAATATATATATVATIDGETLSEDKPVAPAPEKAIVDNEEGEDEEEDEDEEERKKKEKDTVIPGSDAIEGAILALRARGIEPSHPWFAKFLSYRVVLEKPPDEMGISKELLAEAALLTSRGLFAAADLKLDEALSLQVDYLGLNSALINPEVAVTVQAKAESALIECRFDAAKKHFAQVYFMYCKFENPECEGACKALFGLAELLRCKGLTEDSRILHEKVHAFRIKLFGKLSIQAATSLSAISMCQLDLGLTTEAFESANTALSVCIREERVAAGTDGYLYMAQARLILGRVFLFKGDLASAASQLKVANELHQSLLGASHVWTADYLQALAELRFMQCKLLEARKLVGQAVKIRIKTLGKLKYNSIKLKAAAAGFLDQSPEGDSVLDAEDQQQQPIKGLKLPSGLAAPTAADAFGGRAASLDYDLASLIEKSVESITGSVTGGGSVASSKLDVKEEAKRGYHFRGVPVTSHSALADTLQLRGDICLALGDLQEAREMVEGCYAVRKELFGKRSVNAARCFHQLGCLVSYLGVPAEALMLHTIAYNLRLQLLGDCHPALAEAQVAVARTKMQLCRFDEADTFVNDAKRVCKATVGTSHPLYANALAVEAELTYHRGDYPAALGLAEKAVNLFKATYKDVHPSVASVLLLEGRLSLAQGMLDIAQVKLEQAASQRGVFYGDDHVLVAEARHWTVELMREQGKGLEAKSMVEQVLTTRRDKLGKYHPDTISSLALLAYNMLDLGKFAAAAPVFERAAQLLRRSLGGEDCLQASWALFGLAEAKRMEGNVGSSRDLHMRVQAARRRILASDGHPIVLQSNQALGILAAEAGLYEEATKAFDDILAQRRMALGQMHPDVANTLHELGEVLRLRGKLTEARSMHERALKMRRTVLDVDHPAIVDTQLALAQVNVGFGKLEQAAAMFDRCLSNYRLKKGSRHPSVAKTLLLLGTVYNTLGNFEAAKGHIFDSLMLRKSTFMSFNHPEIAESLSALADNLRLTGALVDTSSGPGTSSLVQVINEGLDAPLGTAVPPIQGNKSAQQQPSSPKSPSASVVSGSGSAAVKPGKIAGARAGAGRERGRERERDRNESPGKSPAKSANTVGDNDDGSVVSAVSGFGNELLEGSSQFGGIPGLSRSVVTGRDDRSIDVESVGMSMVEERFGYVSIAEFMDDGEHTLVETGGVKSSPSKGPGKSSKAKAKEKTGGDESSSVGGESNKSATRPPSSSSAGGSDDEELPFCLPIYERCLDMMLKVYGLNHPRTWAVQHSIANTLLLLGHFSLAHDLFLHVVIARRGAFGDDHLDTVESLAGLAEALRLMSRLYPEQTPEAAGKRKNAPVEKSMGPSLIEHLASILGQPDGLKKQWPPEASSALVLLEKGKTTTDTMHPLLSPPKQRLVPRDRYLGGYQGYAYPTPKKLKRAARDNALSRPAKTFYNDAKWVWEVAGNGLKRVVGEVTEHPLLACLVFGRAELMRARRRIDLAIPLYEEALSIRRKVFRANHPAISDCLLGLGEIFRSENKFSRSQPLLEKVLEIRSECFECVGGQHPAIAEVECFLAMLHFSMGQYTQAEPLYKSSLSTREKVLGESNIATAQTLNNYGGLLHTLGRLDEALPLYQRVLDIKVATYGENHPDTASAKNNLGLLHKAMGSFDKARELYTGALRSQEQVFGLMHTDVASTLNNLAALEVACGNVAEAKANFRHSLEIKRKVLGMENPSVASTLNNLAGLCMSCGEMEDAKDLYDESLRLRRQAFGDDHPSVAESLNNIGLLLFSEAQFSAALPLFERSIVIKTGAYGEAHLTTSASMHNLAIVLHKLRRFPEAEAMYTRALEIRNERLGPEHADTRATYSSYSEMQAERVSRGKGGSGNESRQLQALERLGRPLSPPGDEKQKLIATIGAAVANLEIDF